MSSLSPENFESRPFWQRISVYIPLGGILLLAIAILVFSVTMGSLGWRTPTIPPSESAYKTTDQNIGIYVSPATERYLKSVGGNYEVLLKPWFNYFSARGIKAARLTTTEELRQFKNGVVVLPSAIALSDEELRSLIERHQSGNPLLVTWASGTRHENGLWRGWDYFESLGVRFMGEIPDQPIRSHLVFSADRPPSYGFSAGERIQLSRAAEKVFRFEPVDPKIGIAARVLNWARIVDPAQLNQGAVLYGETGQRNARVVVLGFAETSWEVSPGPIHKLLDNAFSWLNRESHLSLAAWPKGFQAAHWVEMDTEQGFENSLNLASDMSDIGYRGTFFLLSSIASQYPEVAKQLAAKFETGLHGDIHVSFKGQDNAEQGQRVRRMLADYQQLFPGKQTPAGFRAPTEGYDQISETLIQASGFKYHLADPARGDIRLPEFVRMDGVDFRNFLLVIPRTLRDDLNLLSETQVPDEILDRMKADLALSVDNGGVGVFSVHSQNYAVGSPIAKVMPAYFRELTRNRSVWLTNGQALNDWWRDRLRIRLRPRYYDSRIEFDLSILEGEPISGTTLSVTLPSLQSKIAIRGLKANMPTPQIVYLDGLRAQIIFDTLAKGDYLYQIFFE